MRCLSVQVDQADETDAASEVGTMASTPETASGEMTIVTSLHRRSSRTKVLRPPTGKAAAQQQRSHFQLFNDSSCSATDSDPTIDYDGVSVQSEATTAQEVQCLFEKAYEYLSPGKLFRSTVYLYAERKLLVFFLIHFACTIIIWIHFFYIKFETQKENVPAEAPYYWWKRVVPPLEFGAMHAILFQMALIPLTMARYTIANLSESVVPRFVPLNRTLRMHIHLGYTMVIIVFVATILFFAFFGLLCNNGQQEFCDKFRSEIMCTGYGIMASLLIIAGTSYFRHRIPYEVFYIVHHLVFIMYAITIAHTFDIQQRTNQANRSQTFKWFSATILYYVCDRAAMHLNHKYRTRLVSSSTVSGSNGSKKIILNLRRPALFSFKPGQYAYLQVGKIDRHWHPFSIASDPNSKQLQFYVEVFGEKSWTGKLWNLLELEGDCGSTSYRQIDVEIMGPIGTPLAKLEDYSHALAIGTGTGIVPVLSLFKQQVHQLLRLDPQAHFHELKNHQNKVFEVETAEEAREGSFVQHLVQACRPKKRYIQLQEAKADMVRESIKNTIARRDELGHGPSKQEQRTTMAQMKTAAFQATRSIYGTVALSTLPVAGVALIGLMLSWNTTPVELKDCMVMILKYFTVAFQCSFALVALIIWDTNEFLTYIDIAMTIIAPFADWYWFIQCKDTGRLAAVDLTLYCLLTAYMIFRLWSMAVIPRYRSWKTRVEDQGVRTMERFDIVWVCRSATMVSEILPDIDDIWKSLVDAWGDENASRVCRVSIYVTEKDAHAIYRLEHEVRNTLLYKKGCIHTGRPDLSTLIQDHTIELIATRRYSHSLLAYVGSPQLAQEIHHCKISNDMVTAITGNKNHQMEFVSESYGGVKAKTKKTTDDEESLPDSTSSSPLDRPSLIRQTTSYDGCEASNHVVCESPISSSSSGAV